MQDATRERSERAEPYLLGRNRAGTRRGGLRHPASGGDGASLCSGDLLLEALAACAGVTMRAESEIDFRGTLAVSNDAPVGFRSIRVTFELMTNASDQDLDTLLRLTERYCAVYQTIAVPPTLAMEWTRANGASEPTSA